MNPGDAVSIIHDLLERLEGRPADDEDAVTEAPAPAG